MKTLPYQTFGEIGYVRILSSRLEEKIRSRYKSEIEEPSALGFSYKFSVGQIFPIVNLILILPAIVLLLMWWKGEVNTLDRGKRFLVGHIIYASQDKTTFAHPNGLGILFHTVFEYGATVKSANYGSNHESNDAPGIKSERYAHRGASIGDTWTAHQKLILAKVVNGAEVDRDMSFKGYAAINS